jgi:hypothetical protein
VCTLLYVQHTALRAQSAPGFPCALCSKRANEIEKLRRKRAVRRIAHAHAVIARLDRAIQYSRDASD